MMDGCLCPGVQMKSLSYFLKPRENRPNTTRAMAKMMPLVNGGMACMNSKIARTMQTAKNKAAAIFLFTLFPFKYLACQAAWASTSPFSRGRRPSS